MAQNTGKMELVSLKVTMQMPIKIEKTDIIPLCNSAWEKSFARVNLNRKALSERGWFPMNYALLLNEEILLTKLETIDLSEEAESRPATNPNILRGIPTFAVSLQDLNIHDSLISKHFDAIIGSEERELSKQRRHLDRAKGKNALENLGHAKCLTAGQLFGMTTQLGQEGVVNQVSGNVKIREALATKKVDNKEKKTAELHRRVHAVLAKSDDYMIWTKDELGAMLQYYKDPGDKKMADTVAGRREQWLQRRHRHPLALLTLDHIETYLKSLQESDSVEEATDEHTWTVADLAETALDATTGTM